MTFPLFFVINDVYDTTFNLGEFYVSTLMFRNITFDSEYVLIAAATVHECRPEAHHQLFFNSVESMVKNGTKIPVATDKEFAHVQSE